MARSIADIHFEKARLNNELARYLGGYPEYSITNIYADMPTDVGIAYTPIRAQIKDDPTLRDEIKTALLALAADPEYGWVTLDNLIQLSLIKRYQGIDLLDYGFLSEIAARLRSNKASLIACRKWHGANLEHGAWSLAQASNQILHDTYNVTVLPEEL